MSRTGRLWWLSIAAGMWASFWVALPLLAYRTLPEPARATALQILDLLPQVAHAWGGFAPAVVWPATVFITLVVATCTGMALLRLADRMDFRQVSTHALPWALRATPLMITLVIGSTLPLVLTEAGERYLHWSFGLFAVGIFIAGVALLPFFTRRGSIVQCDRPPGFWSPARPGWITIGLMLLFWLAYGTVNLVEYVLQDVFVRSSAQALLAGGAMIASSAL